MWTYRGIVIKGKKPICIKWKMCRFFSVEMGLLSRLEKEIKPVYFCILGQFSITHKLSDLPMKSCPAKNYVYTRKKFNELEASYII